MFWFFRNLFVKPKKRDVKEDFNHNITNLKDSKQDIVNTLRNVNENLLESQNRLKVYESELAKIRASIDNKEGRYTEIDLSNAENRVVIEQREVDFATKQRIRLESSLNTLQEEISKFTREFHNAFIENDAARLESLVYEKMSPTGSVDDLNDNIRDIKRSTNFYNAKIELEKEEKQ